MNWKTNENSDEINRKDQNNVKMKWNIIEWITDLIRFLTKLIQTIKIKWKLNKNTSINYRTNNISDEISGKDQNQIQTK